MYIQYLFRCFPILVEPKKNWFSFVVMRANEFFPLFIRSKIQFLHIEKKNWLDHHHRLHWKSTYKLIVCSKRCFDIQYSSHVLRTQFSIHFQQRLYPTFFKRAKSSLALVNVFKKRIPTQNRVLKKRRTQMDESSIHKCHHSLIFTALNVNKYLPKPTTSKHTEMRTKKKNANACAFVRNAQNRRVRRGVKISMD